MGLAPTLLKLSNGEQIIANGELNFIDMNQVDTTQTNIGKLPESMNKLPTVYQFQQQITSFIATP